MNLQEKLKNLSSTLTRKGGEVPAWLFLVLTVAYNELLLQLWVSEGFQPGRVLAVAAFALGLGGILALVTSFLPKGRKWVSVALALVVAVIWLMEFFLSDAYGNFMTPNTIFAGAGGVADEYMSIVLGLLGSNWWRIALALLPTLLYALLGGEGARPGWKLRVVLAALAVGGYLLGYAAAAGLTRDYDRLGRTYEFDSTVRCFGLQMGLVLETTHASGSENAVEFVAVPTESAPVEIPGETSEETQPEETVVYGENTLGLDFAALAQESHNTAHISIYNYLDTLKPSKQNAYTGLFAGKNLILITAEAFTSQVVDPERTPTLYRLATEGIHFTDYYQPAWGSSTTGGEFSNLVGLVPTNGGMCMKETIQQNLFLTMGHQLQRLGYYSTAYHNHNYDFYDRHKTHTYLGYDKYLAQFGGLEGITTVWPESDLELMEVTVPQYIDHQPFSIYYMTVSGHCVYSWNDNAQTRKHYDEVADMDCSEPVKCYYACQLELEAAMKSLVEQLEAAGIADDTVIVLSTDHYPYGLERSTAWKNGANYLPDLYGTKDYDKFTRDSHTLILWSGCLEDMDIVIDEPVYSLDILPTLSNLFGVEYDSRLLVGRDIFSDEEALVLWPDHSWKTAMGTYNSKTDTFTPAEGAPQVDENYRKRIDSLVANKINFCRWVLDADFYNAVAKTLGIDKK